MAGKGEAQAELVTEPLVRDVVMNRDDAVAAEFYSRFGQEVDLAITVLARTYGFFQEEQKYIVGDERTAIVLMFIHGALNAVTTSLHLLVHGYPVPSGHMMRHFVESIAMAMLCADERTEVHSRYLKNPAQFDVGGAIGLVRGRRYAKLLNESLGFDKRAWSTIEKMTKLYDHLSHASGLSMAFQVMFSTNDRVVLGAAFDEDKMKEYRSDFVRRRTAAESLEHVVPIILEHLPRRA